MGEIFSWKRAAHALDFTGERWTSAVGGRIEFEHLHRYLFARDLCHGKDVLDVACGEGYGAALLGGVARRVFGVDIDRSSISHAGAEYSRPNLHYVAGDARRIPLAGGSIDVAVSFETFEHFAEQETFLAELRRVLRPDGLLVISTPDSEVYSPIGGPANPYHVRELSRQEFVAALSNHFPHVVMMAQRPLIGSAIVPCTDVASAPPVTYERRDEIHFERSPGLPRGLYLMACASQQPIAGPPGTSLYIHSSQVDAIAKEPAARTDLSILQAELSASRAELNAVHVEPSADRATAAHVERLAATTARALAAIRDGAWWRALESARRVGRRFPRLARFGRCGSTIARRTLTPQLRAKLREFRTASATAHARLEGEAPEAAPAIPHRPTPQLAGTDAAERGNIYRLTGKHSSIEDLIGAADPKGSGLRIDLGCGFTKPPGFIGFDNLEGAAAQLEDRSNVPDVLMDLNRYPLPLPDNSCREVRSSHFMEHSLLDHVIFEVFRVLKPKGRFIFTVPYANSAEGMYPGHLIFLTEKFFHHNMRFLALFRILNEEYKRSPEYDQLPTKIKDLFPFEIARKMLYNACIEMTITAVPKK